MAADSARGATANRKSGFVTIAGRPNSGKSTLLNRMVGRKVSIVAPRAQTTRTALHGIASDERGQIVFLDTPGIHRPLHKMNERMMRTVVDSLDRVDLVMLMVDASAPRGSGERFALEMVGRVRSRRFLLLNKIDRIAKPALLPMIDHYRTASAFDEIVPVSALKGDGVEELRGLIYRYLPAGPMYYPPDQISDRPERFLAAEIIREKLILETRQELPHATAVVIDRFQEGEDRARIHASIYVERDSQKAIVIGRGGELLKRAGTAARRDIEALLDGRVHLELHVKVRRKWRDDDRILESLGI